MTIKVLEPPLRKGDSFIVAINGNLRVVDPKTRCHGYANCCVCKACMERQLQAIEDATPQLCECDHPIRSTEKASCFKCGKPMAKPELAEAA